MRTLGRRALENVFEHLKSVLLQGLHGGRSTEELSGPGMGAIVGQKSERFAGRTRTISLWSRSLVYLATLSVSSHRVLSGKNRQKTFKAGDLYSTYVRHHSNTVPGR